MNKYAGAGQQQEAASQQHLQIRFTIKNKACNIQHFTHHSNLPPRTQHPRPHKSKQEEGARAWQDLQGQNHSFMHNTRNINTIRIQYLLHVTPCPPPDPRSGQAASKVAPPAVQATRAGLQPPPRPLSCCYINQSHQILPVVRESAWQGLETWVA